MVRPTIERGAVIVPDEESTVRGDDPRRPAQPDEVVPALILIIEDLLEEIGELKTWRENSR